MDNIFSLITNAFGSLWKCRPRGASIEIITPFPTSTDMYVSVFLTKRDDAWIVTDGGFIDKGTYGLELPSDDRVFSRAFEFFFSDMEIKTVRSRAGDQVYYKNTSERALVPNIVFDLAQFVSQTISIAAVQFREHADHGHFGRQVKTFLQSHLSEDKLSFNLPESDQIAGARFSAIIRSNRDRLSYLNLASGNTPANLRNSIARASFNLDFLTYSTDINKVANRIVLINDDRMEFDTPRLKDTIELCRNKGQLPISWKNGKEQLLQKITA